MYKKRRDKIPSSNLMQVQECLHKSSRTFLTNNHNDHQHPHKMRNVPESSSFRSHSFERSKRVS